ncbi:MAG: CatB-related O-acetyltransferase [Selenomonadaceae bacterium]|nr:CatB-related O-acetyltransferase [Selenomonadaceae bacterium]
MTPIKVLFFGIDDLFPTLQPFYEQQIKKGTIEVVGYVDFVPGGSIKLLKNLKGTPLKEVHSFDKIILSTNNEFILRRRLIKDSFRMTTQRVVKDNEVIDGRIFSIPGFNFMRFNETGIAYGEDYVTPEFPLNCYAPIYPRSYETPHKVDIGIKSYISSALIEGRAIIEVGNFTSISWLITLEMGLNNDHRPEHVSTYALAALDWRAPEAFYQNTWPSGTIKIGSDVWIGRGCCFKASGDKPLIIGNGAVIAADSVVVSDVPPFAIVGGNPAKVIKYRFKKEIIDALERIQWWNWDLDKLYDNYALFDDPENFVKQCDEVAINETKNLRTVSYKIAMDTFNRDVF